MNVRSFFEWHSSLDEAARARPWLMLGKGPSFEKRRDHRLGDFNLLGLNHACCVQPVLLTHLIDWEVVEQLGEALIDNSRFVVIPWVPHVRRPRRFGVTRFDPGRKTLLDYVSSSAVLSRLAVAGRLLTYDLWTEQSRRFGGGPVILAAYFSSTAALNLLCAAGVRKVVSLGVDGGRHYANEFNPLRQSTLLAGGQSSYDLQFQGFAKTLSSGGVDFSPLDVESPIKVYVGTEPEQMLATAVLEHSIRAHASMSVEVIAIHKEIERTGTVIPAPASPLGAGRTPFSFQRFAIPALKGYRGRAIYVDSDMQVFSDIRELWTWPMDGAQIASAGVPPGSRRKPQFSVMLLDCEVLRWNVMELIARLDRREWTYEELVYEMAAAERVSVCLPPRWNSLERFRAGETALLHYTDMNSQPWLSIANPLARLWCRGLFDAIDRGAIGESVVRDHVRRGWVRPSLAWQVQERVDEPLLVPREVLRRDEREFVPPHARLIGVDRWREQQRRLRTKLRPWLGLPAAYARRVEVSWQEAASPLVRKARRLARRLVGPA